MSLGFWVFDKPVVGHDQLGAADHSSVDQDARFELILSCPADYILLVIVLFKDMTENAHSP